MPERAPGIHNSPRVRHTVFGGDDMGKKRKQSVSAKQPLPAEIISENARHGKTADDLPEPGDLPTVILAKEIPATDLHDM